MSAQSVVSLAGRARSSELPERQPAPAPAPAAPSASERRLKLVIESAPVSLWITDSENKVLAANRAALTLLGVERLDDVIGKPLDRLVTPSDRERFLAFVAAVCRGEAGALQYELVAPDGTPRRLETHAVPLRREASAPAAFLGATWDVGDRQGPAGAQQQLLQKIELLEAQRSAERETWEEALRQARSANEQLAGGQSRFQSALSEAEERHSHAASEWAAERNHLLEQLNAAEGRHGTVADQWTAERNHLLEQLKAAEGRHGTVADQWTAERNHLLEQLKAAEGRHGTVADQWAAERNSLLEQLKAAEGQLEHAKAESAAQRHALAERLQAVDGQHRLAAQQWTAERDGLVSKLREVEERHETLAAQLLIEQNTHRMDVDRAERDHEAELASRAAERQQLEQSLAEHSNERDRLNETLQQMKAAHDRLAEERDVTRQALQETQAQRERQAAQWASERDGLLARLLALEHAQREYQASLNARIAENHQLEQAIKDGGARYEQLLVESRGEREQLSERLEELKRDSAAAAQQWRADLAEVLSPLKATSTRIERLLDGFQNTKGAEAGSAADDVAPPVPAADEASDAEPGEEATWRF